MSYKKGDIPKVKLDIPNAPKFDLGDLTESMSNMDRLFDNIAKDIRDRQDNAVAMEFTKCIGELLKNNGVVPKMTEYTRNFETDKTFETRYGVSIDELDFSEHDKVFEDKIAELKKDYKTASELLGKYQQENESLKKRIAELEAELEGKETVSLPFEPMETANYLTNATYERETNTLERNFQEKPDFVIENVFTIKDLEQIAEHLLVYCKHNRESE